MVAKADDLAYNTQLRLNYIEVTSTVYCIVLLATCDVTMAFSDNMVCETWCERRSPATYNKISKTNIR